MHTNLLARPHFRVGVAVFGGIIATISLSGHAFAATTPATGQALEIGPPVITLTADPGQKITASLDLRDVSSSSLVVSNEVDDFTAAGEDGTPKVILNPTDTNPYSLRSWISTIPSITLKSRDVKSIPVTINVPSTVSPGGYYGIIRFTGTPPGLNGTGVALNASLGALVFVRINGATQEGMQVAEFSANNGGNPSTFYEASPINFVVRLKNTGNIYEQPSALVTITDMFGHQTATLPVNADQHIILSQTIRKFTEPLDDTVLGNRILFGMYHARLDVQYGTTGQKITQDFTFWVIPWKLITAAILIIIAVVVSLIFLVRRYNRAIVKRAQRRK